MRLTFIPSLLVAGTVALLALPVMATDSAAPARPVPIYTRDGPPATPALDDLPLKESLTQNGITWTFDRPVHAGEYITGDWYVVGPVTVVAIDPKPLFGDEVKDAPETKDKCTESLFKPNYARNGSTLNLPAVVLPTKLTKRTMRSGFDSRMPMAQYDETQFTKLPIAMKPGDSLVSSASVTEKFTTYPVKSLAVLTCVAAPQPPDAFRPSFCQTATCKPYLARNLRRDLLLRLPKPADAAGVRPADFANNFSQSLWVDSAVFGRAMPRISFPFDGDEIAEVGGEGSLLLLLDYTPDQKEPLLLNMTQVGIDLYGLLRGGRKWHAEGGINSGRKWLIMFAGLMLDDPEMADLRKSHPEGRFNEDEQVMFCPLEYQGRKFERGWTGAKVIWTGHFGYVDGHCFAPNQWPGGYGPVELFPPAEWPMAWPVGSEWYRRRTSPAWVAQTLAAHLMHAEKLWSYDAYFAYVDRWMTEDDAKYLGEILKNAENKLAAAKNDAERKEAETDIAAIKKANPGGTITSESELAPFVKALWDKYRNNLPPAPGGSKTH